MLVLVLVILISILILILILIRLLSSPLLSSPPMPFQLLKTNSSTKRGETRVYDYEYDYEYDYD